MKIFLVKKTIDQIRFSIKEILSLGHFRSIFYHDFRSLWYTGNCPLEDCPLPNSSHNSNLNPRGYLLEASLSVGKFTGEGAGNFAFTEVYNG